jgi:hypothetical protein
MWKDQFCTFAAKIVEMPTFRNMNRRKQGARDEIFCGYCELG